MYHSPYQYLWEVCRLWIVQDTGAPHILLGTKEGLEDEARVAQRNLKKWWKALLIILIKLWVFSALNLLYDIILILFIYFLEALDREDADTFLTQKPLPWLPSATPKLSTLPTVNSSSHKSSDSLHQLPTLLLINLPSAQPLLQTPTLLKDNSEQLLMAPHHNFHQIG